MSAPRCARAATAANIAALPRAPATSLAQRDSRVGDESTAGRVVRAVLCGALLLGPSVLMFFSGGLQESARNAAAITAWALLAVAVLVGHPRWLPRRPPAFLAMGGLGALATLVCLSGLWAPLAGPALDDRVRLALYLATFLIAVSAWPSRQAARRAEPAFAAGALAAVGYGLSERLLPDLVALDRNLSASNLLEQPLNYWNALGALAAIGIVLCARLVGDVTRPPGMRSAGAAALAPLGAGLILTQSRGAVAALAAGLAALVLLAPERRQLRAAFLALAAAGSGALAAIPLPAVRDLQGTMADRRLQGLLLLTVLILLAVGSVLIEHRAVSARGRNALPRPSRALAPLAVVALVAVLVPALAGGGGRGVGGNRDEYWAVAVGTFADHPLLGAGAGAFVVEWSREREIEESVQDAHSLYLETAAELGILGLLALGVCFAGVIAAGRGAHRVDPALATGPCAVLSFFAVHAAVDWDWEVPALAMPVLVMAGLLIWREGVLPLSGQRAD